MLTMQWFFGDKELEDAHAVRRAVFIEEQCISKDNEFDGTDAACVHLVLYKNQSPVATGRIMITSDDYTIGRVAVLKDYRGQNLGFGIMQALIQASYDMGSQRQILSAQTSARAFYEKLGFKAYGNEYDDAGIPHIAMERFGPLGCCGKL